MHTQYTTHGKVALVCPHCSKIFYRWPSHIKSSVAYCSQACRYAVAKSKVTLTCQQCGKTYERWPSEAHKGESSFCSNACASRSRSGEKAPNWKGGRTIAKTGYVRLCGPEYPDNNVYEHRWVMSQHLGRPLLPTEHVHHINGDKLDNRIENLELITATEHNHLHFPERNALLKETYRQKRKFAWSRDYERCVACGTTNTPHNALGLCKRCYYLQHKSSR